MVLAIRTLTKSGHDSRVLDTAEREVVPGTLWKPTLTVAPQLSGTNPCNSQAGRNVSEKTRRNIRGDSPTCRRPTARQSCMEVIPYDLCDLNGGYGPVQHIYKQMLNLGGPPHINDDMVN
ncbi:hypothetical protein EYF80_001490 [Liparis tanakae]|uniref:Uncharacterized protein n=1 Tax=Liparis tanakae TaxID=230148 RepID=A0A4Z2JEM3_9TELE|nr:hypothetical protein EYF80_001490 [Liparis tanakae]